MLVATDIAARGIDVVALGHVVNFDVPAASEDYIHRVGRTGRAELTGEAFTFVAPEDEPALRAIERAVGKPLPRVMLTDFDYRQAPDAQAMRPAAHRPPAHGRRPQPPRRSGPAAERREPQAAWASRLHAETGRPQHPSAPSRQGRRGAGPRRGSSFRPRGR